MRSQVVTLVLTAAAALAPTALLAAQASGVYLSQGDVPEICAVQQPVLVAGAPTVNVTGYGGSAIAITELTDSETLAAKAASFTVGFDAVCNYPHRVIIESQNNGLWRDVQTATPAGFADGVNYSATLDWANKSAAFNADAMARRINELSVQIPEAAQGQIALRFEIRPGASNRQAFAPLLAGIYHDTIRVTVAPQ